MLEKWKGNVHTHIPIVFRKKNPEVRLHFWPTFFREMDKYQFPPHS